MMVELIPKREQKPIFGQMFFLIVSAAVLAAVVASFFILQQLIESKHAEREQLELTFVEDTRPLEEELSSRLLGYKKQVDALSSVLRERKTLLPFFALLERTTHPDVFFRSFDGNAATGVLRLNGEAESFFVLEQQRLAWENRTEFAYKLSGLQLGQGGAASFSVEFVVTPGFLDSP